MIFNYQINLLTEDELSILFYILENCPKTSQFEVDFPRLLSYKQKYIKAKLEFAAKNIKEEYLGLLDNIKVKLDVK